MRSMEKGHNHVDVPQSCGNRFSRRLTLTVVALLLVLLEVQLLSSNVTGFFRTTPASPDSTLGQTRMTPVPRIDPAVQAITGFLKKFEVSPARRKRLAEALVRSSRKHKVDPRLAASIMIVESRGNPFAISPSNAVGIMQ